MMRAVRRIAQSIGRRFAAVRPPGPAEKGNAVVEFLGVALLLLVPLIYLIFVLARVQAATYAVQGAAQDVGRAYVLSESTEQGAQRGSAAVGLALQNQGFDATDAQLELACEQADCLAPGGTITASVTIAVSLPGVPAMMQNYIPVSIPVSATHVTVVDQLRGQP